MALAEKLTHENAEASISQGVIVSMFKEEHSMNPSFYKKSLAVLLALFLGLSPQIVLAEEPPVKKSKSGICHAKGSTYYSKTKNYTPYQSMEACLKSGGRRPKR